MPDSQYKFDYSKTVGGNNFFNSSAEIKESINLQNKFISTVDYSDPANFARFGSAEEYYKNAINYISLNYPYDNCTADKLKWINSLNDLEYYIFDKEYPRYSGYVNLSGAQHLNVYSHVQDQLSGTKEAYEAGTIYTNNTVINFSEGITFEAWMKFEDSVVESEILTITALSSSINEIKTIKLLDIKKVSGSTNQIVISDGEDSYSFNYNVTLNDWHHYAIYICSSSADLFVDGTYTETINNLTLGATQEQYVFVPLGLMLVPLYQFVDMDIQYDRTSVFSVGGGCKTSYDEVRLWNSKRSVEKIGRYWFTNIDGNDFSDPDNSSLLFYYKFNEGWDEQYRILCLDSSGRKNDATIINHSLDCISSGSAINESGIVIDREREDIIFGGLKYSQAVQQFYDEKVSIGKEYDETNNSILYNKFPGWILQQEESLEDKHLKQLMQIVCSYFDDLYGKIKEISKYKTINYETDLNKIYPFYDKILTSMGFNVTDLFSNLNITEKIISRNDTALFDQNIGKIKNAIYKNIYNNLAYILKSKGTEKSIKAFLNSYGINENLVKINLYADSAQFNSADRTKETVVKKKTLTLTGENVVYNQTPVAESEYFTLETCIAFDNSLNLNNNITSSIVGFTNGSDYYYVTLEKTNSESHNFVLNHSGTTFNTASVKLNNYNIYDNTAWSLSLRKKPSLDTLQGAPEIYSNTLDLYITNKNTHFEQDMSCSLPYITGSQITYFLGAKKENIVGDLEYNANCKYLYCNFWSDYLNTDTIIDHNRDILSYGSNE